ncbi:DUF397 domain-containing protein [Streptomyces sp. NPDC021622]|uniref:DUF397 domain-containing protein n=1 Tax=Streptomyces sp. NPDC021622 TaxID=3155013 RepID=UPI0033CB45D7
MATVICWQKSSYSGGAEGNECLELASVDATLLLRESDDPTRILTLPREGFAALLREIQESRRSCET